MNFKLIIAVILIVIGVLILAKFYYPSLTQNITQNKTTTTTTNQAQPKAYMPIKPKEIPGKGEIFIYADHFEPKQLNVKLGEVVKWINKDKSDHILILSRPPIKKKIIANTTFRFTTYFKGTITFKFKEISGTGTITIS